MWNYNPNLVSAKSNLNCLKRNVMCSEQIVGNEAMLLSKRKVIGNASAVCLLLVRIRRCNAFLFVGSCSPLSLCKKAVTLIQNCTVLAACC